MIAFLFPGQGSQKVGMGAELLAENPELFGQYLDQANAASGLPIRRCSLEGPQEELTDTKVAQPALFALSLALFDLARGHGLRPDFVAGHSLGEYTAAVASGALSVEDGMELVSLRGRLMAEIQSERPGAMAAVIGLDTDRLSELCEQGADTERGALGDLNSPRQIVVSGAEAAGRAGAVRGGGGRLRVGLHRIPIARKLKPLRIRRTNPRMPCRFRLGGTLLRAALARGPLKRWAGRPRHDASPAASA